MLLNLLLNMWPTSNGYPYTDEDFYCKLQLLKDEFGNIVDPISPSESNIYTHTNCDVCSTSFPETHKEPVTILPCVIRTNEYNSYEVAAHFLVALCPLCQKRALTIMKTSDHATISSKNWQELVSNFKKQLTDPGWEKYDYEKARERLYRSIAKKLVILNNSNVNESASATISHLPFDVFGIIGKYLVHAEEHRLATMIQSLYRGWCERPYHTLRNWYHSKNCHLTYEQAKNLNLWTTCDDCNTRCQLRDTYKIDACAHHMGCCSKIICKNFCRYKCPKPECSRINKIHQDNKHNDGDSTFWNCLFCNHQFVVHELWYGLSEIQHQKRYG